MRIVYYMLRALREVLLWIVTTIIPIWRMWLLRSRGAWQLIQGCTVGQWWSLNPNPGCWPPRILISVRCSQGSVHFATQSYHLLLWPDWVTLWLKETSWATRIGKAEPGKWFGSQPFAKFCTCVLHALPAGSSKSPWPFRHVPSLWHLSWPPSFLLWPLVFVLLIYLVALYNV